MIWMALFFLLLASQAEAGAPPCVPGLVNQYVGKYRSHRTGYYPEDDDMEGGYYDRRGVPLKTLQQYLRGKVPYVSVAMDTRFAYGTKVRIPAIEKQFGRCIDFRVVDTGGNFYGAGGSKIDICNSSLADTGASHSNGPADIYIVR